MVRWISEDRVTELRQFGRLRDTFTSGDARPAKLPAQPALSSAPLTLIAGARVRKARDAAPPPCDPPALYSLVTLCRSMKLPEPIPEYRFHPLRKWRADYCWPAHMLMLEVEGGLWTNGRHSRGTGAIADLEKYSEAAIMGYRILYCTPDEMHNGVALDRIMRALTDRAAA